MVYIPIFSYVIGTLLVCAALRMTPEQLPFIIILNSGWQRDFSLWFDHTLKNEVRLQSLFRLHVHLSTAILIVRDPASPPPPPPIGRIYEGAIGQPP